MLFLIGAIEELRNAGSEDMKTVARRFRDRAREEAIFFLGAGTDGLGAYRSAGKGFPS